MAFCKQCGRQIPDNANACPYCGTPVRVAAPQQAAPQQAYQQAAPRPAAQSASPADDVQQSKPIAWLSYIGLLFLIPMFVRKNSPYTRFHVKQGVLLCVLEIIYGFIYGLFTGILFGIYAATYTDAFMVLGILFDVFFGLIAVVFDVWMIMGIIYAATGKQKELFLIGKIPWIGDLLDKTVYKN